MNSIAKVFPSTAHGFYLQHLKANFMRVNDRLGKALREKCWAIIIRIMFACTAKEYNTVVSELASTSIAVSLVNSNV